MQRPASSTRELVHLARRTYDRRALHYRPPSTSSRHSANRNGWPVPLGRRAASRYRQCLARLQKIGRTDGNLYRNTLGAGSGRRHRAWSDQHIRHRPRRARLLARRDSQHLAGRWHDGALSKFQREETLRSLAKQLRRVAKDRSKVARNKLTRLNRK